MTTGTRPLPPWLRVHPQSLGMRLGGMSRWFPVLNLIWLYWMLAAPWYMAKQSVDVWWITGLSLPLFLLLYARAWFGDPRRLVWNTAAIAVLGLAMVAVNWSWSYVIYAAVLIPCCTALLRSLAWLTALMAVLYIETWLIGFQTGFSLAAIGMCGALALISLFSRMSRQHDAELRLSHDEVRRLAATAERERIGRDLHDLLGHTLSLIAIKGELARRLFDRDPDKARHEVAEIERIAREALAEVRSAVTGFRAAGLAAELASARLLLESSGIALDYRAATDLALTSATESALALSLREAVTNVQRHAHAGRVEITLSAEPRHAVLVIHDDGRGGATPRGNGLAGIEERLRALGGHLLIESPAGRGTRLILRVPRGVAATVTSASQCSQEAA